MSSVRWRTAGQQRHLITRESNEGHRVLTACGLTIQVSSVDYRLTDPLRCVACTELAKRS